MPKNATKSPKTTGLGVAALIAALASLWAPPKYTEKIQTTALLLSGSGLVAALDPKKKQQ